MELLDPEVRADLFDPDRPVRTKDQSNPSTYYGPDAKSIHSLVADGCIIEGEVENSILSRGVSVEAGRQGLQLRPDAGHHHPAQAPSLSTTPSPTRMSRSIQDRMLMGHSTYPLAICQGFHRLIAGEAPDRTRRPPSALI